MITNSLKNDHLVKAVFLKGSMGRKEEDKFSDVDLYVLVDDEEVFLPNRKEHVKSYRKLLFYDDIFIIAPQILAVYDNWLHLDLFTVTEKTLLEKDYFKVLYDPEKRMEKFISAQILKLSLQEFIDSVDDAAFFLLQYKKASGRGNDLWSVKMLQNSGESIAKILLHRYSTERAQLGLKTVDRSLPRERIAEILTIQNYITPASHTKAVKKIACLLVRESAWIHQQLKDQTVYTLSFLRAILNEYT
ncbi:nucleotidyltransferase domain-containing protein [Halobacillus massiliensis]|uniref:nucleotidyltransferase domain-containing protein n=1 Tax=Halobacillus massiliensis TaxID=1926286 RepID=UPI0009E56133|nr:nucleotidyltransferase domain-containing protein [Halobacillus massiliensis]